MKSKLLFSLSLSCLLLWSACSSSQSSTKITPENKTATTNIFTEAIFLQVNDVYEIDALDNGRKGGLARVATELKALRKENPNTFFVMAGDFFNPSVIGTMKYEGKAIKGRHMVDILNKMGLDFAILGNHEFDLDQADFQERVNESKFNWISTDVVMGDGTAFAKKDSLGRNTPFATSKLIKIPMPNKKLFKIGLFSATIPLVQKPWIKYNDYNRNALTAVEILQPECDVILGLTHLEIKQDRALANRITNVPLFMGGHDHDNMRVQEGNTYITKADANAKSIYIHRVKINNQTRSVSINSELKYMDERVTPDSTIAYEVSRWKNIAENSMKAQGFTPTNIITSLSEPLDGRESVVRHQQCPLGTKIASAILAGSRDSAVCSFFNSGSVRIDDKLTGNFTEYDVIRTMPYGGAVTEINIKGALLKRVLDAGDNNKGKGGYLQRSPNIAKLKSDWLVNNTIIEDSKSYKVITSSFLFAGKEAGIEFFNKDNPNVVSVTPIDAGDKTDLRNDVRKLFIDYLRKK